MITIKKRHFLICCFVCLIVLVSGSIKLMLISSFSNNPPNEIEHSHLKSCRIMTANHNIQGFKLGKIFCEPFMNPWNNEVDNLQFVRDDVRDHLLFGNVDKSPMVSNNNSVKIFLGHRALWESIAINLSPMLILEDDVVTPLDLKEIENTLSVVIKHSSKNFVFRLYDDLWLDVAFGMTTVGRTNESAVKTCQNCQPLLRGSSTAAYVVDYHAAQTMLAHSLPVSWHVDMWMQYLACSLNQIQMFVVKPNVVKLSGRASLHYASMYTSLPVMQARIREYLVQMQEATCVWGGKLNLSKVGIKTRAN